MTKIVYQTDPVTGEYRGPLTLDEGDLSPRDPGVYLIPGGCVVAAPPKVSAGHAAIWRGEAWELIEDHRGETVYLDGIQTEITELGPIPDGATAEPPPPAEADNWATLRAERDARLAVALAFLDRHRNQVDFGLPSTLSAEQATAWAVYAQALRDLPERTADPASPDWPEAPR